MSQRKVRNDRKRDIKPIVPIELKNCIYRLSSMTGIPVKDVVEECLAFGIKNRRLISYLSRHFLRDIEIANTIYIGDQHRTSVGHLVTNETFRISTRVPTELYMKMSDLEFALNCSLSRACALLLEAAVRDAEFPNKFARSYLERNLSEKQMQGLVNSLHIINAGNPFDERISWAPLLTYLLEEVRFGNEDIKDTVSVFLKSEGINIACTR